MGLANFMGALRIRGSWLMQDRRASSPVLTSRASPSELVRILVSSATGAV